jgi:2-polyprenyl-3-methyl-5-hydroxy-6-metoxy-1,4-benzoquinol methylase
MTETSTSAASPSPAFEPARAEAFAGRMVGILNESFTAMMISIGHQTGLFDLMSGLAPSTSEEIARAARLNERYVREWLGALVVARILEYDAPAQRYRLPAEHAAFLTKAARTNNLAAQMIMVSCMAEVEPKVIEAFRKGGGVPYSAYSRFTETMKVVSAEVFDDTLVQRTLPLIPGLVGRLESGIEVLDVGCGSGHAVNVMARAFPKSRFTGYDFSQEGVAAGLAEATASGLENARFELVDVATLKDRERFDFITAFDAIHDQAKPRDVLAGIARALRKNGVFLMVDIRASSKLEENLGHPMAPMLYSVSTLHCMTVSLALDGEGLGTVWGEQKARELLSEAGFADPDVRQVEGDIINSYYITRLA